MKDIRNLEPLDYLRIPWRRRWYVLAGFMLVTDRNVDLQLEHARYLYIGVNRPDRKNINSQRYCSLIQSAKPAGSDKSHTAVCRKPKFP